MTHQTNAQRLADAIERYRMSPVCDNGSPLDQTISEVCAELRRLSAIEQERDQLRADLAAVGDKQAPSGGEVVAWVRQRSDGGYEGPLLDLDPRMDETRRKFWIRLSSATPKPVPMTDQVQERLFTLMNEAAGEGLNIAGIDCAELFFELFPDHGISEVQG